MNPTTEQHMSIYSSQGSCRLRSTTRLRPFLGQLPQEHLKSAGPAHITPLEGRSPAFPYRHIVRDQFMAVSCAVVSSLRRARREANLVLRSSVTDQLPSCLLLQRTKPSQISPTGEKPSIMPVILPKTL